MTITEIKEARLKCEENIKDAINKELGFFTAATGVIVAGMDLGIPGVEIQRASRGYRVDRVHIQLDL